MYNNTLDCSCFHFCTEFQQQSQQNQERFDMAVKHLLEHENFSADSLLFVAKEERSQDLNRTVKAAPQSNENRNNEHRGRHINSLDPL